MSPIIVIRASGPQSVRSAGVMASAARQAEGPFAAVLRSRLACQLPRLPIIGYEGGRHYRSLGFGGRLLDVAPSVERRSSSITLQFTPIMNKDRSLRVRLCWTLEELARNVRQMGWPIIWKNARRLKARLALPNPALASLSELSIRNGMPRVGFDLAADFLYSIVVFVDFMSFQARDIRSTWKKLVGAALGGASTPFAFIGSYRYRQAFFLLRRLLCNSLKSRMLGV
jgi:hypothetical protein